MPSPRELLGLSREEDHFQAEKSPPETEREAVLDLLRLIHESDGVRELIRDVTVLLRAWTGCEAMGVRLRDGADFPYFETQGFPEEHVQLENRLCALDEAGEMVRDSEGNPVLECMCGNVLCGRFDPSLPFFTEFGSFWTDSTSELLASTDEADRLARTRNRCRGEGYESVALVPLRHEGAIHGLLQLNDSRKHAFSADTIRTVERLADHLAAGLRQREETSFPETLAEHPDALLRRAPQAMILLDSEGRTVWANSAAGLLAGLPTTELYGKRQGNILRCASRLDHPRGCCFAPDCGKCPVRDAILATLESGTSRHHVEANLPVIRNGVRQELTFLISTSFLRHGDEPHALLLAEDISERKRRELALQRKEEELSLLLNHTPIQICYFLDPETYGAVNQAHADFVGRPKLEIEYSRLDCIFPSEVCFACREENRKIFATARPRHSYARLPDARGETRLFVVSKVPSLNRANRTEHIVCTAQELTPPSPGISTALREAQL